MAIEFKIHEMPKPTSEQEVAEEHISKCIKFIKRADINLRKKMKKIAITQAEAWKKSRCRG